MARPPLSRIDTFHLLGSARREKALGHWVIGNGSLANSYPRCGTQTQEPRHQPHGCARQSHAAPTVRVVHPNRPQEPRSPLPEPIQSPNPHAAPDPVHQPARIASRASTPRRRPIPPDHPPETARIALRAPQSPYPARRATRPRRVHRPGRPQRATTPSRCAAAQDRSLASANSSSVFPGATTP